MGIRMLTTANQTRLLGHILDAVANTTWLRQGKRGLIHSVGSRSLVPCSCRMRFMMPSLEAFLDTLGIGLFFAEEDDRAILPMPQTQALLLEWAFPGRPTSCR